MTDKELIKLAYEASEKAYAPYSDFHVGAALLTEDGEVYTGCNVENASYGGCICAERTAAVKAVSEGKRRFKAIAIVNSKGGETYPCGICRQFLNEFADDDMRVVIENGDGEIVSHRLSELLPHSFKL